MPKFDMRPLIFTDLDGTLLDHDTYSAEPAASLIRTLHEQSVADVIPVTSKTQMELAALDCDLPFVNAIKDFPEVIECHHVTGDSDFLVIILTKDIETYNNFIVKKLSEAPNVGKVRSSFSLSLKKRTTAVRV